MKKGIFLLPILFVLLASVSLLLLTIYSKANIAKTQESGNYDQSQKVALFHGQEYKVPNEVFSATTSDLETFTGTDVLGSKSKNKRIEVDLSKQKLYAFENGRKIMSFNVSTGKWAYTPTGNFQIWTKLKYTLMTGGSKENGTYYYLPNVPFTMYFYKDFGIHGAYWHDNFGHPMSHGCVNMRIADAEKLFYWANPKVPGNLNSILASNDNAGTRVVIYGETPNE